MDLLVISFNDFFSSKVLLVIAVAAFLASYLLYHTAKSPPNLPPGSFGLPLLGENIDFVSSVRAGTPLRFLASRVAKNGDVFKTSLLGHPTVVVCGPSANKFLFTSESNGRVLNYWPSSVLNIVGDHAPVCQYGAKHRRLRHLMLGCLSPQALQKFVGRVDEMTRQHFAEQWDGKEQVTVFPLLNHFMLNVACSFLVSVEEKALSARLLKNFSVVLAGMLGVPINFPGTRYHKAKAARTNLVKDLGQLIEQRTNEMRNGNHSVGKDMLSMLLSAEDENGDSLTPAEIHDLILFLLFAGHGTNTSALTFVVKFLAENPSCYNSVLAEQLEIATQKNPGDDLTWADLQKMKYTWRVIQETLRLSPPVQGGMKVANEDIVFNGYSIPKGWKILYSFYSTHHNAEFFPNPEKFDPSRFDQETHAAPAPYTFLPFGGGPHVCPGAEFTKMTLSVFVHRLVSRFKWAAVDPNEGVTFDPMACPRKGYPIHLFTFEQQQKI